MLLVTVPASDPLLMTVEQMRIAAGLADNDASQDAALGLLNARISAEIYDFAHIAPPDDDNEPTIRQETLTETFRCPPRGPLMLSRRHHVEVLSVKVDGDTLDASDFEAEGEAGLLHRIACHHEGHWHGRLIEVTYKAGFETVPASIVGAASDLVRFRRSEVERDPLVRSQRVRVDGVDEVQVDYWVNAVTSGSAGGVGAAIPPNVAAGLARIMNTLVG